MDEFKDMLKYFREREGLSQFELSQKLGVAPSTIGMYEQDGGFHSTDTQKITRIEKKLHSCGMAFPTAMHIFTQRKTSAGAVTEVFLPRKGNAYEAWVYT